MVEKLSLNRKITLDLADYTPSMSALHHILTDTPMNKNVPSVLPPFTTRQLQEGLRYPWTAEQIGGLYVNYESEWYADESLSKWNALDSFYQKQVEQKRQTVLNELNKVGVIRPIDKEQAFKALDKNAERQMKEWQIEKQQRIKPSLWWNEVATAQAAQLQPANTTATTSDTNSTENTTESTSTSKAEPVLSSLSTDGKAWHLHPVGMRVFETPLCMCNKNISLEQFQSILPADVLSNGLFYKTDSDNLKNISTKIFVDKLNNCFVDYGITSCLQKAHFLSQVLCETDFFRAAEEYKNIDKSIPLRWNRYSGGSNYHGRGLIQLTHDYNYSRYGKYVGDYNIKDNPEIVSASLQHTVASGFWYWINGSSWGNINNIASNNDFLKVTIAVNGGYKHVVERNKALMILYQKFNIINCNINSEVRVDNYSFNSSGVINSQWYRNNPTIVAGVERELVLLYNHSRD